MKAACASADVERLDLDVEKLDGDAFFILDPHRCFLAAAVIGGIENPAGAAPGKTALYVGARAAATAPALAGIVGSGRVVALSTAPAGGDGDAQLHKISHAFRNVLAISLPSGNSSVVADVASYKSKVETFLGAQASFDSIIVDVDEDAHHTCTDVLKTVLGAFSVSRPGASVMIVSAGEPKVWATRVKELRDMGVKPREQLTMEPFHRNVAAIVGQVA